MHQKQNKGLVLFMLSLILTIFISSNALAYTLATPQMTSNTLPSGTVTFSQRYTTGLDGWKAFDRDFINTGWAAGLNTDWLAYQFATSKRIIKYSIYPFYTLGYTPTSWTYEGWNGTTWVVLDTQSNIIDWVINTPKDFIIDNPNTYIKYRINITSHLDSAMHIGLNELLLYEPDPDSTPPSVPAGVTSTIVYTDKIILDWVDNIEPDFQQYRIVRDNQTLSFTTDSTFTESNLLAGNTYNYQISAIDINGNESSPSTIAVATAPPVAPSNISDNVTLEAISFQAGLIISAIIGFVFWVAIRRL